MVAKIPATRPLYARFLPGGGFVAHTVSSVYDLQFRWQAFAHGATKGRSSRLIGIAMTVGPSALSAAALIIRWPSNRVRP